MDVLSSVLFFSLLDAFGGDIDQVWQFVNEYLFASEGVITEDVILD